MVIVASIVAVLLLFGFFALIKLTPHKGAGIAQKPHPAGNGPVHPHESRTSDLN